MNPVDIGIWFPFGNIATAIRTDFPVPGYPYTLGDPTYWKLSTAVKFSTNGKFPSRMRGASPIALLGGMHLTHYGYLPHQIVKRFTLSESSLDYVSKMAAKIKESVDRDPDLVELEKDFAAMPEVFRHRMSNLTELYEIDEPGIRQIAVLPWFYNCNRERYPSWEGRHDTRLDI